MKWVVQVIILIDKCHNERLQIKKCTLTDVKTRYINKVTETLSAVSDRY